MLVGTTCSLGQDCWSLSLKLTVTSNHRDELQTRHIHCLLPEDARACLGIITGTPTIEMNGTAAPSLSSARDARAYLCMITMTFNHQARHLHCLLPENCWRTCCARSQGCQNHSRELHVSTTNRTKNSAIVSERDRANRRQDTCD